MAEKAQKPVKQNALLRGLLLVGLAGLTLQVLLGAFFLSITHSPKPHNVPIGVVAPSQALKVLQAKLEKDAAFEIQELNSKEEAIEKIQNREIYGAIIIGPKPVVLVASAASPLIASAMRANVASLAYQGHHLSVQDIVPLPKNDSNGAAIALLVQVLVMGGILAGAGSYRVLKQAKAGTRKGLVQVTMLAVYALLSAAAVLWMASWFGVADATGRWELFSDLTLISLAVSGSVAGFTAWLGFPGVAVAGITYFLLGNLISGANLAPPFLNDFWRILGQNIPTGAGATLLRNEMYFNGAALGHPIIVLSLYAGIGLLAVLLADRLSKSS